MLQCIAIVVIVAKYLRFHYQSIIDRSYRYVLLTK